MGFGRRFLAFPLVRIVLAGAPIVVWLVVAQGLRLPGLLVAAVVPALYYGYVRLVERRRVDELGAAGAGWEVAQGVGLGVALFGLTMGILIAVGVAHVSRGDGARALLAGLAVAATAALGEEILLRAIFFRILEESLGSWIALAASAALFGVLHAFNRGATVVSTIAVALEAGVILAAAYLYTRRLWMALGLHAAWNFTEGGIFGAQVSGHEPSGFLRSDFHGASLLSGGAFGPEASIVAVLVCLAAGLALLARAHARGRFRRPFWKRRSPAVEGSPPTQLATGG
jgi:membrane protease YdiL (CAAX protease family)